MSTFTGRRGRGGCCRRCGYDLRGHPAAACPECGAIQHQSNAAAATIGKRPRP